MAVGSGKVSASTVTSNSDNTQTTTITYLNPTQQITMDGRNETDDLDLKVEFLDIEEFIKQASPEIIKELILNKAEIDKENDEFIAKKKKELEGGNVVDDQTSLKIKSLSELGKVSQNLENLIGNIAKQALEDKKLSKELIDKIVQDANSKITDTTKKLDLNNVKPLDKTAGVVDPELEEKKKEELRKLEEAKLKKELKLEKTLEEAKKKLADALKKLEVEKKKLEVEKKAAEDKAKADAEAKLKSTLSEQEKKAFDDAKRENRGTGTTNNTTTGTDPGPSNPGTTDPGTTDPTKTRSVSMNVDVVSNQDVAGAAGPITNFNVNVNLLISVETIPFMG